MQHDDLPDMIAAYAAARRFPGDDSPELRRHWEDILAAAPDDARWRRLRAEGHDPERNLVALARDACPLCGCLVFGQWRHGPRWSCSRYGCDWRGEDGEALPPVVAEELLREMIHYRS